MKVAVLGGGNGAHAAAADLAQRGIEVSMYSVIRGELDAVEKAGGINLVETGKETFVGPIKVPKSIEGAVSGADAVAIIVPSTVHSAMAEAAGRLLEDGQYVILDPGHTGGALEFREKLRVLGAGKGIVLGETMTLTYITRLLAPGKVEIFRRTKNVLFSTLPAVRNAAAMKVFSKVFPNLSQASNVLETGLSNVNAMMHPPGMLLNAGWIEHTKGGFKFYSEGLTPAVCNVIEKLDEERLRIAAGLGVKAVPFTEIFYNLGSSTVKEGTIYESIMASGPNRTIQAPNSLDSRYVHEDVGHGLVAMAAFAAIAGVETPLLTSLVNLACRITGVNYWQTGRSAKRLGIEGMDKKQFMSFIEKGAAKG